MPPEYSVQPNKTKLALGPAMEIGSTKNWAANSMSELCDNLSFPCPIGVIDSVSLFEMFFLVPKDKTVANKGRSFCPKGQMLQKFSVFY